MEKYVPDNAGKVLDVYKNYDPDGYYFVTSAGMIGIGYNTAKVKEADAPKNWTDLLDPKWKDNIALGHPGFSGYVGTWALTLRNQYGWEFFEKLAKNNPRIGRSINDTVTMLNAGESAIAGCGPVGTLLESVQKGNPLAMVYPTDGTVLIIAPSGIMKGCKHPKAARLFMEFLLTAGASQIWVDHFNETIRPEISAPQGRQIGQGPEDHSADRRTDHQGHSRSHQAVARNVRRIEHDPDPKGRVWRKVGTGFPRYRARTSDHDPIQSDRIMVGVTTG